MTRITYIKVPLKGKPSGPWYLSTDRRFEKHTSDEAGPYKEVRQYLSQLNAEITERGFDVLEVTES